MFELTGKRAPSGSSSTLHSKLALVYTHQAPKNGDSPQVSEPQLPYKLEEMGVVGSEQQATTPETTHWLL